MIRFKWLDDVTLLDREYYTEYDIYSSRYRTLYLPWVLEGGVAEPADPPPPIDPDTLIEPLQVVKKVREIATLLHNSDPDSISIKFEGEA